MFLNDLLQYSRRNMDENEAYNRGLKGQKRGYLYDIMTNPNYGFTNATRQGAGQNLGFDVEMPQNPQEQQFLISEEMQRRFGQTAIDPQTGQPTRIVPGSVLSGLYSKETPMTKANQGLDQFYYEPKTRYDAPDLTSQYLGRNMNAFGLDLQQPDWDYYKTGDLQQKGTYLTRGQGVGGQSMQSQDQTFAQRQVPRPTGGSGKIDPLAQKSSLLVQGTNNNPSVTYNLPNGIKQLKEQADRKQKELDVLKAQGIKKEPDPNNPGKYIEYYLDGQTVDEVNQQQNALDAFYNGIATQPLGSGHYVVPDTVYNVLFGGKGYIGPKKPDPNASTTQTLPNYSAVPGTGNIIGMGTHDSTAMVNNGMGYAKIKKGKNGKWYKEDANGVWHEVTQTSIANDYPDWIIQ